MKPDLDRFLEIAAAHLLMRTGPAVGAGYEQSSVMMLGILLQTVREEAERAAARRVEENGVLRALFRDALDAIDDTDLRERLRAASDGVDSDLTISALEGGNALLRGLLIELHEYVEGRPGERFRWIEDRIWNELVASTDRRRLSFGAF